MCQILNQTPDIIMFLNPHHNLISVLYIDEKNEIERGGFLCFALMSKNTHFTTGKTSKRSDVFKITQGHTWPHKLEPGYPALQANALSTVSDHSLTIEDEGRENLDVYSKLQFCLNCLKL